MTLSYQDYISQKRRAVAASGFEAGPIRAPLFEHQSPIVRWALRLGRAAVFADTGLGKTAMQLEWARQVAEHAGGRVLVFAAARRQGDLFSLRTAK